MGWLVRMKYYLYEQMHGDLCVLQGLLTCFPPLPPLFRWICAGVAGEPILVSSEEEIFQVIDFPYKKPEERNV